MDFADSRTVPGAAADSAVSSAKIALSVSPHVPVIRCDARQRESTKYALTTLVEHAMKLQLRV